MRIIVSTFIICCFLWSSKAQDSVRLVQLLEKSNPKETKKALDSLTAKFREHYFANNFLEIIKQAEIGIDVAERTGNHNLLWEISGYYANALLVMKDTARAKKIFESNYKKPYNYKMKERFLARITILEHSTFI